MDANRCGRILWPKFLTAMLLVWTSLALAAPTPERFVGTAGIAGQPPFPLHRN